MTLDCRLDHDWFNAVLTFGLCCGLIISYLPQHFRIINAKSSEGLSPVFLLLGTTSAASAFLNMITLQAPMIKCCSVLGFSSCLEMTAGVIQLGIQWFCFTLVFVLYMMYYPDRLKYIELDVEEPLSHNSCHIKTPVRSEEWRLSIILAWLTAFHFVFIVTTSLYLYWSVPSSPSQEIPPIILSWATFLGVSAALLATVQYAPQILHTYRTKLVGALSIPMMLIQTPGGILMITSIVLRPGTNWTSWITFAVAAVLQGCLLIMCLMWKVRQRKLGVDDFGLPFDPTLQGTTPAPIDPEIASNMIDTPSDEHAAMEAALANALESAAETNLVGERVDAHETTPLLTKAKPKSDAGRWSGR